MDYTERLDKLRTKLFGDSTVMTLSRANKMDYRAMHGDTWGGWTFRRDTLVLEFTNGYYVDLEELRHADAILDWIMQCNKAWISNEDYGCLVRAIQTLINPQNTLVSGMLRSSKPVSKVLDARAYILENTRDKKKGSSYESMDCKVLDKKKGS